METGRRSPAKGSGTGRAGPVGWTKHSISEEEVDALRKHFTKVLELPGDRVKAARHNWGKLALIVRSTGRRVPAEWVAKDVGNRGRLRYDVEAFPIAEDHLVLRFQTEEDRDNALAGGPWFVAGQLLAMEPWVPDFVPGPDVVKDAVVWLRLPKLPLEFWDEESILSIAAEAGRPLAVDNVTGQRKKVGFARVKVVINSVEPLVPGIQIRGENRIIWQPFVFENLPCFCYRCGRIGHEVSGCNHSSPLPEVEEERVPMPMVVETVDKLGGEGGGGSASPERQPVFGPWLATTRFRLPPPSKTPPPSKKTAGEVADPTRTGGSSSAPSASSPPDSPPDSAAWQKPAKLARRRSPPKNPHPAVVAVSESIFNPLSQGEMLEEDREPRPRDPGTPAEADMRDASIGSSHLKRSWSPVSSGRKENSATFPKGRRLPESWKTSLQPGSFKPGHAEVRPPRAAPTAKGKTASTSIVRRLQEGEARPEGMTVPNLDLPAGHAQAVRQIREAMGLSSARADGGGDVTVDPSPETPRHTEEGVFTFHGKVTTREGKEDEAVERSSRADHPGTHGPTPRTQC